MARMTKAQREWRPGQPKKPRSTRVMFASTVLTLEAFLAVFVALARGGIVDADAIAAFSALLALNYGWVSFASAGSPALGVYGETGNYDRALGLLLAGIAARAAGASRGELR